MNATFTKQHKQANANSVTRVAVRVDNNDQHTQMGFGIGGVSR
jgi:hypothetical protein